MRSRIRRARGAAEVLILFGAGFALKALWWLAVIVLVVWLLGFVIRSADTGGRKGRWYRW
ncbi:hydrophobic protein [Streptomyces sviceus]|uniref:hydrophobic protein n=1 Tax=Streptomyces sviceus TaxID=285530 RepID=UPI00381DD162